MEILYGTKHVVRAAEWRSRMASAYLWMDYISVPQPLADDVPVVPGAPPSARVSAEAHNERTSRSTRTTDHRFTDAGASREQQATAESLGRAVESIPACTLAREPRPNRSGAAATRRA